MKHSPRIIEQMYSDIFNRLSLSASTLKGIDAFSKVGAIFGTALLGWYIGGTADKTQNLRIETYIKELRALDNNCG